MLVQTEEEFEFAVKQLSNCPKIVFDTETPKEGTQYQKQMMGVGFYGNSFGAYFPFRHQHENPDQLTGFNLPVEWIPRLKPIFTQPSSLFIAHHMKFDMPIMENDGIDIVGELRCTMLMSHMQNENRYNHSLDSVANELVGGKKHSLKNSEKNFGAWEKIPPRLMGVYCVKDCELTGQIHDIIWPDLVAQDLAKLWPDEAAFIRALANMERIGIAVHIPRAMELSQRSENQMAQILTHLGFDPNKPSQLARKLFSEPPEGLGLMPGELSKRKLASPIILSGGIPLNVIPKMDRPFLRQYAGTSEVVDLTLEYRGHVKAKSTWFDGFLSAADADGRVHPNFKQHGTVTTRLSCEKPNMQQLPRTSEDEQEQGVTKSLVKTMLSARPGFELWEFDYSQIEFRLAACYAQDKDLLEAYREGSDMHQVTADKLGIPRNSPDGSKPDGKKINFMVLYGAGAEKLHEFMPDLGVDDAHSLLQDFWQAYPGLRRFVRTAQSAAQKRGFVRLWTGRRRHFRFKSESHKAANSVIQGGAAEIVKRSILKFHRNPFFVPDLVAQVHDALWFEIPIDTLEGRKERVREITEEMEWPTSQFILPFPVDSKVLYAPVKEVTS